MNPLLKNWFGKICIMAMVGMLVTFFTANVFAKDGELSHPKVKLPILREKAVLTPAPEVPPPITRRKAAIVEVYLNSGVTRMEIKPGVTYDYWTFNGQMPGPFIRVRQGDTLEVHHTNS